MTTKTKPTGGLILILLLGLAGRASAEGGVLGPTSWGAGPFPYSDEEGQRCANDLRTFRAYEHYGAQALPFRNDFESCVGRLRQKKIDDEKRAQRQKEAAWFATQKEAAEAKRHQEALEAAEQEAKLQTAAETAAKDPNASQELLSALLCDEIQGRVEKLAALAKDRKYSRIGGVVNLQRRADLQDAVEKADDCIKELRAELKERKRPPLGCRDKRVLEVSTCLFADGGDDSEACTAFTPFLQRMAKILNPRARDDE